MDMALGLEVQVSISKGKHYLYSDITKWKILGNNASTLCPECYCREKRVLLKQMQHPSRVYIFCQRSLDDQLVKDI
jgi:hypothetical protein